MVSEASNKIMALVQFTDGFNYICKIGDVTTSQTGSHVVKYKDRRKYAAFLLVVSANLVLLNEINQHLQADTECHVDLEQNIVYTGTQFSSSKIVEKAKSILKDENKLFINEKFLPNIDITSGQLYKFPKKQSSTDGDKVSLFLEADILQGNQGHIIEETNLYPNNASNEFKCESTLPSTEISSTASVKPRVISIETVNYDFLKPPDNANTTYNIDVLSIDLGEVDGQDIPVLNSNLLSGSIDQLLVDNILLPDATSMASPHSFNLDNPPPLSSTVIESSVMSHVASDITEDETCDDITEKDKDYQMIEESDSTDSEASAKLSKNELEEPVTFTFSNRVVSAPDDVDLIVNDSSTPLTAKKYFCLYCNKLQSKLARHLELVHSNEEDVKKFIDLPKGNPERNNIIATLRKTGNHMFNTERRFNDGTLIVCRRPNKRMQKTAKDFIACAKCKGQYTKSVIRHHWRRCTKVNCQKDRIVMVKGRAIMSRIHEKAEADVVLKIFAYLREDDIVRSIRYDELIILFANKQYEGYSTHQHFFPMIRARIRLLGRLLIAIKKINVDICEFASIYKPRHYDSCIRAVKEVAQFDNGTRKFKHPAVASNLGTLLKQVGEILRSKYIKSEDEKKQKQVEDFLKLHTEDYGISINKAVTETRSQNIRRKKVQLPSIADITTLQNYLKTECKKYSEILEKKFCNRAWHKLSELTLVSLQIFNRRRAGEIERLQIKDFESYEGMDSIAAKDVYDSMSHEAQRLAKHYVRFMIRGKLGRAVPVLVPSDVLRCMELIKKLRHKAKVREDNPYFFGLHSNDPQRHKYLRACDLLRNFSVACGAKVPSSLRGTMLRKHVATHCINLNLSDAQVSDLANFMGHDNKIHKEIYRQPIIQRDIVKISKLLELAQGGRNDEYEDLESAADDEQEDLVDDRCRKDSITGSQSTQYEGFELSAASKRRFTTSTVQGSNKKRSYGFAYKEDSALWLGLSNSCTKVPQVKKYLNNLQAGLF